MDNRDGAFFARPEHERCQAGLTGCNGARQLRLHCTVEGSDIQVCAPCAATWRLNATSQSLYNRCPRCAEWKQGTRPRDPIPALPPPLSGPVADAVNAAMHKEGLTIDVRTRILQRLAQDAPKLATQDVHDAMVYGS